MGALGLALALTSACGSGPSKDDKRSSSDLEDEGNPSKGDEDATGEKPDGGKKDPGKKNAEQVSIEAFKKTLYPLLTQHCDQCHAKIQPPYFASTDAKKAHSELVDNHKIDFSVAGSSRIVVKLTTQNHNCWSGDCVADAGVLEAAIEEWVELLKKADAIPSDDALSNVTEALAFTDGEEVEGFSDPATIVFNAEDYASITAPFTVRNDDDDEGLTTYIMAPNGQVVGPNGNGGLASYTFEVTEPGIYTVWARVKAPNGNSNAFNIRMDDGPFTIWNTAITMNEWAWNRATANNGQGMTFDLAAGMHTVTIKQREAQTRFNRIAITKQLEEFQGAPPPTPAWRLRFDLQGVTGKKAVLTVDASEFDSASKTIMLRNLAIETEEMITIQDVMPLVNGRFNPQHATFRLVDAVVEAPGAVLSEAALILIGEQGWDKDELSFTFGKIE